MLHRNFRKKISNSSDEELLALYMQTNSPDYFGELYNRYIPQIYGLCLQYLQKEEKAESATLDLFEILLPKVSDYKIEVFKTWMHHVAKNYCLQILQKEKPQIVVDYNAEVVESDTVLHLLENNAIELNHCIAKLPKPQKTTISMFFMEKMSYADIAEQTGYLLNTIKNYIQNGKKNLKIYIEK